jgi:hypothetical protein
MGSNRITLLKLLQYFQYSDSVTDTIVVTGSLCKADSAGGRCDAASGIRHHMSLRSGLPAITHHSAADTLDKVDEPTLVKNAAVEAILAFWIADRAERLAWPWPPVADQETTTRVGLQ